MHAPSPRRRVIARRLLAPVAAVILTAQARQCPPPPQPQTPPERTVPGEPYSATIRIRDGLGHPVNRLVLGNNVQWVENGDGILRRGSLDFQPDVMEMIQALGPTVLRYPGGSQSDVYDWRHGVGARAQRKENENYFQKGHSETVFFGTEEFLRLCDSVGAEPLITVNLSTGTAEDAAAWVRATNVVRFKRSSGKPLPRVRYWELDNEPYLRQDARPELHMEPAEYARRASEAILAMRKVDPDIMLGIPLRSDTVGTLMLPQQSPGFAEMVLSEVDAPFDFVSLHDAYFPFIWQRDENYSDQETFRATMAAPRVVENDIAHIQALLRMYEPGRKIPIAITEYNALVALGGPRQDEIATLGGALYVADLLRIFAEHDDILMANYWSLVNNWYFGAIANQLPSSSAPEPRPAYQVLHAYDQVLRGRLLRLDIDSPTFDNESVGLVPAFKDTPLVSALGTADAGVERLLVINKDATRPLDLTVTGPGRSIESMSVKELSNDFLFDAKNARRDVRWRPRGDVSHAFPLELRLPPHSIGWIELKVAR